MHTYCHIYVINRKYWLNIMLYKHGGWQGTADFCLIRQIFLAISSKTLNRTYVYTYVVYVNVIRARGRIRRVWTRASTSTSSGRAHTHESVRLIPCDKNVQSSNYCVLYRGDEGREKDNGVRGCCRFLRAPNFGSPAGRDPSLASLPSMTDEGPLPMAAATAATAAATSRRTRRASLAE